MDNVGTIDSLTIQQKALREAFKEFPVKAWTNSEDLLYGEPFGRDPMFWPLQGKEGIDASKHKAQLPWEYQDGKIFTDVWCIKSSPKAYLLKFKFATFWVPKKQIDFDRKFGMVWLPMWLIKDKSMVPANWDNGYNPEFEWEPALVALGLQVVPSKSEMKQIGGKASVSAKAKEWKYSGVKAPTKGGD